MVKVKSLFFDYVLLSFAILISFFATFKGVFFINYLLSFILSFIIAMIFLLIYRKISRKEYLNYLLLSTFILLWVAFAFNVANRQNWMMENFVLFIFVALLIIFTKMGYKLSTKSYIFIYFIGFLHIVGAHYIYSNVPFGFLVADYFNLTRNHYDRIVHFLFGLLMFLPVREIFIKNTGNKGIWSYLAPIAVLSTFSLLYEVLEWLSSFILTEGVLFFFLSVQKDTFDVQKDMAVAFLGAFISAVISYFCIKLKNNF